MIDVKDLHKSFGKLNVLQGINETIEKGERVVVIGPSGSGKSTFLRCLNLLEEPTSGHIFFEGTDLMDPRNDLDNIRCKIGMVFQHFNLFPHKTILENITLAPIYHKRMTKAEANAEAMRLLERIGLADKANAYPAMLSGGQKQRVAIVRALAMKPDVMLFDEPTSALDPELVGEVLSVIRDLAANGMPMIMVTHQMEFARAVATEILFMEQGRVIERGSPSELLNPLARTRTRDFFVKLCDMCGGDAAAIRETPNA